MAPPPRLSRAAPTTTPQALSQLIFPALKSSPATAASRPLKASGASRTTQLRYGRKARKGWEWWFPGDFRGQSIDAHEAGAKAFRDELIKNGIEAQMSLLRD